MCLSTYLSICPSTYVYMCVYIYIYKYKCVCVYVYMYIVQGAGFRLRVYRAR